MSVLKRSAEVEFVIDDPQVRTRRAVGLRVCTFAAGFCQCRNRRDICARVEAEAAAIIDALRTMDGAR